MLSGIPAFEQSLLNSRIFVLEVKRILHILTIAQIRKKAKANQGKGANYLSKTSVSWQKEEPLSQVGIDIVACNCVFWEKE